MSPDHRTDEVAVLALAGDLDISAVDEVAWSIRAAQAKRPTVLVLDLRRVTFLDSSILGEIVAADRRARRSGRRLAVAVASEVVRRVFRITLLQWRLEIVDDPAEIEAVPGPDARADGSRGR